MRKKLLAIIEKHNRLSEEMTMPDIFNDQQKLTAIAKEHKAIEDVVNVGKKYLIVLRDIEEDNLILEGEDQELKQIALEDLTELELKKTILEKQLKVLLLPKDPNDDKNLILEIR